MNGALIALCAITFALGIAAGNGPRLITATRGAAQAWQPRRAPAPFTHLTEGITIMSADNFPGRGPADDDENGPDAEVFDFDTWTRAGRPGNAPAANGPRPVEAARPASSDEPGRDDDTPDDDDADHESILVDQIVDGPAVDPPDEPRPFRPRGGRDRRPVIPAGLASRAALAGTLRWAAGEAGTVDLRAQERCR